jgi:predicted transcriptional regulator of viral defense system
LANANLDRLPATFSYREALAAGFTKRGLYALRDNGLIEPIARGLYRRVDAEAAVDLGLLEIARRAPRATLCLTAALAHHDLTDANPVTIDVALPARAHRPAVTAPVTWHMFDRTAFDIGREELPIDDETTIGIYNQERCVIDAFRLRHREGDDLAYIALRRWLRRRGNSPSTLIAMTRNFPTTTTPITRSLEIIQHDLPEEASGTSARRR